MIEFVRIDHHAKEIFFIGASEYVTPDGEKIEGRGQALFHVEHSAAGVEERPLNAWRIVNLTQQKDEELEEVFKEVAESPYLRVFNEIYLREDQGLKLERK